MLEPTSWLRIAVAPVVASILVAGCGGDSPGTVPPGGDGGAMMMSTPEGACPGETTIAFDTTVRGTTGEGWNAEISGWFDNSDVACTPWGGDYPPPYRVYSLTIPDHSDWDIVVRPDPGVDVALVSWMRGLSFPGCNPLEGTSVVTCEVSNFEGAGGEEWTWLNAVNNPYHVVILVSTPPGGTPGGFELRVVNHRR